MSGVRTALGAQSPRRWGWGIPLEKRPNAQQNCFRPSTGSYIFMQVFFCFLKLLFESFYQNLRVPAALIIFLAARRREVVRCALGETALALEIGKGLSREREEFVEPKFPRLVFDELEQLPANALVFVRWTDI